MPLLYRHIAQLINVSETLFPLLGRFPSKAEKPEDKPTTITDWKTLAAAEEDSVRLDRLMRHLYVAVNEIKDSDVGRMMDFDLGDESLVAELIPELPEARAGTEPAVVAGAVPSEPDNLMGDP